jgi:uncharacterized membrane protein YphA (DoxX/SURF4 family)
MNRHPFIILITGILTFLWAYSSFTKLTNLKQFKHAMLTQVFPRWIGKILVFLVPIVEITLMVLLIIPFTRLIGMYSSLFTLLAFTIYVGGAVFKIYDRTPCACGGLFNRLGWYKHFKLNIILTIIAFTGAILMDL